MLGLSPRSIAATITFYFLLPDSDRCPMCDEPTLRVIERLLRMTGHVVTAATSVASARAAAQHGGFDVIISDLRMPQMDGLTLLGHARQIAPQMPVIVMTAFGTVESAVTAMRSAPPGRLRPSTRRTT